MQRRSSDARTPPASTDGASQIGLPTGQIANVGAWLQLGLRDPDAEAAAAGQLVLHPELGERLHVDWFTRHEERSVVRGIAALRARNELITVTAICEATGLSRALLLELADPVSEHRWSADVVALAARLQDLHRRREVVRLCEAGINAAHVASDIAPAIERLRERLAEVCAGLGTKEKPLSYLVAPNNGSERGW